MAEVAAWHLTQALECRVNLYLFFGSAEMLFSIWHRQVCLL